MPPISTNTRHRIEPLESRIAPAVFLVTNLHDSGPGSLREAVLNANADTHPGPRIIEFTKAGQGHIVLTSGVMEIDTALTIAGPGPGKVIIDGDANSQIFDIPSASSHFSVTIAGVSLINGKFTGKGGAIGDHQSLTLVDTVVSGNSATDDGGGVYADPDFSGGAVKIINSTISGNNSGNRGGGLYLFAGKLVQVSNSTITGNIATGRGGGLYGAVASYAKGSITNSRIQGNTSGAEGGGVAWLYGPLAISGSVISNNLAATKGGGIYIGDNSSPVIIVHSTVEANQSSGVGGGIADFGPGLTIVGSNVSGNSAESSTANFAGGGIYASGTQTVKLISSVVARNTSAEGGGGIAVTNGTDLDVISSLITGNSTMRGSDTIAAAGGGIYAGHSGKVEIISSTISNNYAFQRGGGLYFTGTADVLVVASKVLNNFTANNGAGLSIGTSGTASIINSLISGNSTASFNTNFGGGGLLFQSFGGTLKVDGGAIVSNHAAGFAGGVYIEGTGGSATLSHVLITGNTAGVVDGGVKANTSGPTTTPGSIIADNIAPSEPNSNLP